MKKYVVLITLACFVALSSMSAGAHCEVHAEGVQVKEAWVRASVPQQRATGVFMNLESPDGGRLLGAASPVARVVEVHEMTLGEDGVMRMREVPAVELPACEAGALKPGGYHIMLIDLVEQLKEGERVPLSLSIETAQGERKTVEVEAEVRPLTHGAGTAHH